MARIYYDGQVLGWVGLPRVIPLPKNKVDIRYSAHCYNCEDDQQDLARQATIGQLERGVVLKYDCGTCGAHFEASFRAQLSATRGPRYKTPKPKKKSVSQK